MARVVIFGVKDFASLAHYYLTRDSDHAVVGFSVHQAWMPAGGTFEGLPVVPFETVENRFPPASHSFFAPLSHRNMNRDRKTVFDQITAKGYRCISYISSRATVFAPEAIGSNCFILEDNTIQPFVRIGHNVVLWSGNHIGHHSQIGDHVFFTSHVVLSGHCTVEPYCFFGVNAAIRDGLRIAEGSLIAMSACLVRNTDPWQIYTGVPARASGRSDAAEAAP